MLQRICKELDLSCLSSCTSSLTSLELNAKKLQELCCLLMCVDILQATQAGYLGGGGPGGGVAAGAGAGPHPGYHVMAAASSQRGGTQAGPSWPSSARSTESETKITLLVY